MSYRLRYTYIPADSKTCSDVRIDYSMSFDELQVAVAAALAAYELMNTPAHNAILTTQVTIVDSRNDVIPALELARRLAEAPF